MATSGLPAVRRVALGAPVRWLAEGWRALWASWTVSLPYGVAVAAICGAIAAALIRSNLAGWALALACGLVLVAPVLAMGNYETGRRLETRQRLSLRATFVAPQAFRGDVAYLGVALFIIFGFWIQAAQIV